MFIAVCYDGLEDKEAFMKDLRKTSFEETVYDDEESCLVLFSRKTCPICASVTYKLNELEDEFKDIPFYHIDSEAETELMNRFKLKGVPQVLLFSQGKEQKRLVGDNDIDDYAEAIESLRD